MCWRRTEDKLVSVVMSLHLSSCINASRSSHVHGHQPWRSRKRVGFSVEKEGFSGCSTESIDIGRGAPNAEPNWDSKSDHKEARNWWDCLFLRSEVCRDEENEYTCCCQSRATETIWSSTRIIIMHGIMVIPKITVGVSYVSACLVATTAFLESPLLVVYEYEHIHVQYMHGEYT